MRSWQRLKKMQELFYEELCKGRSYKCPKPAGGNIHSPMITDFTRAEPRVFLGWQPMNPNEPGRVDPKDPFSVCPAITVMPNASYARYVAEKRFDRYQNVHRNQDMGQSPYMLILFSIYEPGIRLPGFAEAMEKQDPDDDPMQYFQDGTEAGLQTLYDWMDDAIELLLRERGIPGTDMVLDDYENFRYSLFTDQAYVVDRRPLYYGILNVPFKGYASPGNDHGKQSRIDRFLDGTE